MEGCLQEWWAAGTVNYRLRVTLIDQFIGAPQTGRRIIGCPFPDARSGLRRKLTVPRGHVSRTFFCCMFAFPDALDFLSSVRDLLHEKCDVVGVHALFSAFMPRGIGMHSSRCEEQPRAYTSRWNVCALPLAGSHRNCMSISPSVWLKFVLRTQTNTFMSKSEERYQGTSHETEVDRCKDRSRVDVRWMEDTGNQHPLYTK